MTVKCVIALILASFLSVCAQEALTNEEVIKFVKAGLSDDTIIRIVKSRPTKFVLGADAVLALKDAGVSDKLLAVMLQPATVPRATPAAAAVAVSPQAPISEVGVYFKFDGRWQDVLPETVSWQNWYMLVQGKSSKTRIAPPAEFLIYAPEGVAVTEYQLLKLKERPTRREFMSAGGEVRGSVAFDAKKIASRTFVISLGALDPGEYAFMPPGAAQSTNSAGSLGKLYTFQIIP
jgi:hypothetical protein